MIRIPAGVKVASYTEQVEEADERILNDPSIPRDQRRPPIGHAIERAAVVMRIRPGWCQRFGTPEHGTIMIKVLADREPTYAQECEMWRLGLDVGEYHDKNEALGGYLVTINLDSSSYFPGPPKTASGRPLEPVHREHDGQWWLTPGKELSRSDARRIARRVIRMEDGGYSEKLMFADPGSAGIIGVCRSRPTPGQVKELKRFGLEVSSVEKSRSGNGWTVYLEIQPPATGHQINDGRYVEIPPGYPDIMRWRSRRRPRPEEQYDEIIGLNIGPAEGERERAEKDAFSLTGRILRLADPSYDDYTPAGQDGVGITVTSSEEPSETETMLLKNRGLIVDSVDKKWYRKKCTVNIGILPRGGMRRREAPHAV